MDDPIPHHIRAIAARTAADDEALVTRLARDCSPDRTEPAALPWVRRWAPVRLGAGLPVCGCAAGRCAVCN
jgi:hypothetical protein